MKDATNNALCGENLLRITMGGFFLWMGFLKFFAYESQAVSGLMMTNPLTSWFVNVFGNSNSTNIIGFIEILTAILILIGFKNAKLGAVGAALAAFALFVTSTFLVFGPVVQEGHGFPFLSPMPGQFILKDIPLLGAALWLFFSDRGKA